MLHKIPVQDLTVGMYIVDIGISWLQKGSIYTGQGLVTSRDQLDTIQNGQFTETYVDLSRSRQDCLPPGVADLMGAGRWKPAIEATPPPPTVPLEKEISVARELYSESISYAKVLMDSARDGSFSVSLDEPVINEILLSLDRNADALLGLCKLRKADSYTYSHCVNVSVLSVMFARTLGAPADILEHIGMGGLFHDLGKSLVPQAIINAPRKLSPDEFATMRQHPTLGFEQLLTIPDMPDVILHMVLEHHERYDGTGYPHGLSGNKITTVGSIGGIVDVFDALSAKRAYKDALPMDKVLSMLYSMRNTHFPEYLVDRFIQMLGVYPLGTPVLLSDGRLGVVSATSQTNLLKPRVRVVKDNKGRSIIQHDIELSNEPGLSIENTIPQQRLGLDPATVLGFPASV